MAPDGRIRAALEPKSSAGGVHAKLTYNQKFKVWNAVYYKSRRSLMTSG